MAKEQYFVSLYKHCSKCDQDKPLTEFHRTKKTKSGRATFCKACIKAYHAQHYIENRERYRENARRWEQDNLEYRRARAKERDHLRYLNDREKLLALNNSESRRQRLRKVYLRRYGITPEDYDFLLQKQRGVCGLCGKPEVRKTLKGRVYSLGVDHDHESGRNRGLLCYSCNFGLGKFNDDPALLMKAAQYLLDHKDVETISCQIA